MALKVTNYLKNLGKSTKYMIGRTIEEDYGATYQAVDNAAYLAKETVNSLIHYKTTFKRVKSFVTKSPAFEAGALAYKNAKSSIKTGKFYDEARENAAFDGMDDGIDDDFDLGDDDIGGTANDDSSFDPNIDISKGDRTIARSIESSSRASTTALANTIVDSANMQVEAGKQTASFMLVHQERLFGNLNNSINNLGGMMGGMNGFLNGPMKSHLENSAKFFEESTKYQRENNAILKELIEMERVRFKFEEDSRKHQDKINGKKTKTNISDIINADGSIDWTEYFQVMKKNFSNLKGNYGLDLLDAETLKMMAANPLEGVPMMAVRKIMGKPLENALKGLNKTVGGIFAQVNADLKKSGEKGGFVELLADLFGVKIAGKATLNSVKNNEYVKGKVPFDGITRKSIIEVIPGHLARIEALLGGQTQHFDYESGTWMTMKEIRKQREDELASNKNAALMDYKSELAETIKRMQVDKEAQKRLEEKIDAIADYAWNKNGTLSGIYDDYTVFNGSDKDKINIKALLKAADKRGLAAEIADATSAQEKRDLERSKSGDSIYRLLNSKADRFMGDGKNANSELSNHNDENRRLFQAMVNELYLIRTKTPGGGGRLSSPPRVTGVPDYVDLSMSGIRRSAQDAATINNEIIASAATNAQSDETTEPERYITPEEQKKLDAANRRKDNEAVNNAVNNISSKNSDDPEAIREIQEAKGLKNKAKAFWHAVGDFWKDPRKLIANTIKTVDDSLYNFFFNHNTGEVDDEGNHIHGFFEKVSHELVKTFNQAKDWMKEKVFEPMKEYLTDAWDVGKDFLDGLSGGWFSKFINEFKSEGKDQIDKGKNAINEALGRNDKVDELEQSITDYTKKIDELIEVLKIKGATEENKAKLSDLHNNLISGLNITDEEKQVLFNMGIEHLDYKSNNADSDSKLLDRLKDKLTSSPDEVNPLNNIDKYKNKVKDNYRGSLLVPDYGITTISKGEMIIPADLNPFNPDRDKANRDKDRRKEEEIKNNFFSGILSHADGGNALDGLSFDDIRNNAKKGYNKNGVPGLVGAVLNRVMDAILPESLKNVSAKDIGAKAHEKLSNAMDTALDRLEDFATTLDPKMSGSLIKDIQKLRDNSASMAAGAAIKGGIGAIIGTAIMGPGLGTVLGSMSGIALQSESAKTFLFGNKLDDGSRSGGLISRKYQAMAKKYLPGMAKWGVAGGAIGLLTGFGPLGGAVIGSAASLVQNSEKVNEFVFGKKIKDNDGNIIDRKGGILGKETMARLKKAAPHAAVASLGTFMLTGAGLLPSIVLGTGVGLLTSTETFKDMLFGKKDEDGKRQGGLVGLMKKHVVSPLANFAREIRYDFFGFMQKHLLKPMTLAAKTFSSTFKGLGKMVGNKMLDMVEKMYAGPLSKLLGKRANEWIINPLGKLIGGATSAVKNVTKWTVGLPVMLAGKALTGMAKKAQKFNIKQGIATDLTAGERLEIMQDQDYSTKEFDKLASASNEDELEKLKNNLEAARSQKSVTGSDYDGALRSARKKMESHMKSGDLDKMQKLLHEGNETKILKFIDGLNVDHATKRKLIDISKRELKNIKDAKGVTEFTKEQQEAANKYLKDKGIDIDVTDRSSLTKYIDLLDKEIEDRRTRDELSNGKYKYSTEGAAEVAEGMNETNSILYDILNAITGAKTAGYSEKDTDRANRNANIDNLFDQGRDSLNRETMDQRNAFFDNLGIKYTSSDAKSADKLIGGGKSAKKYRDAFTGFKGLDYGSAKIDLDAMMKYKPKDIKRFAQLAQLISVKELNEMDLDSIAKLTDRQFKQILHLAALKGTDGTPFKFKGDLNSYTNLNPDKLNWMEQMIAAGMSPTISKQSWDTAYFYRHLMTSGQIEQEKFFEETLENDKEKERQESIKKNEILIKRKERIQSTIEDDISGAKERLSTAQAELDLLSANSNGMPQDKFAEEINKVREKIYLAQKEVDSAEEKLLDTKESIATLRKTNKEILAEVSNVAKNGKIQANDANKDGKPDVKSTDGSIIKRGKDDYDKDKKDAEEKKENKGIFSRLKDWVTGKGKKDKDGKEKPKEGGFFDGIFGKLKDIATTGIMIFAGLKILATFAKPLVENVLLPGIRMLGDFLKENAPDIIDGVTKVISTVIEEAVIPLIKEAVVQTPKIIGAMLDPTTKDENGNTTVTVGSAGRSLATAGALAYGGRKVYKGGKKVYNFLTGKGGKAAAEATAAAEKGVAAKNGGRFSKFAKKFAGKGGKFGKMAALAAGTAYVASSFGGSSEAKAPESSNNAAAVQGNNENVDDNNIVVYNSNGEVDPRYSGPATLDADAVNRIDEMDDSAAGQLALGGALAAGEYKGRSLFKGANPSGVPALESSAAKTALTGAGAASKGGVWNTIKNNKVNTALAAYTFYDDLQNGKSVGEASFNAGESALQTERFGNALKWGDNKLGISDKIKGFFSNGTELASDTTKAANVATDAAKAADVADDTSKAAKALTKAAETADDSKAVKALQLIKDILIQGLNKVKNIVPYLSKVVSAISEITSRVCGALKAKPGLLVKFAAKFGLRAFAQYIPYVNIAVDVITGIDVAYHVYQGYDKWYNVAGVLPDSSVTDTVKWMCGLADGIDAFLFGMLGPSFYSDILFEMVGIDLSVEKQRAQKTIDDYNAMKEKPKGLPDSVETIEDYNEKVFFKINDSKAMQNSVADFNKNKVDKEAQAIKSSANGLYTQSNLEKPWYSRITDTLKSAGKNALDYGLFLPATLLTKTFTGKSFTEVISDGWDGLKGTVKGFFGKGKGEDDIPGGEKDPSVRTMEEVGREQRPIFGRGKNDFYKQIDSSYSNVRFNIPGDSIKQTIGDSGCGPIAGVNAIKALGKGSNCPNPIEASKFAIDHGFKGNDTGVHPGFFKSYGESHGVSVEDTDRDGTIANLRSGNPVVLQGESASGTSSKHPFGKYPHYVTATGYDESTGQVVIQDPEDKRKNIMYDLNSVLDNTTTASSFYRGGTGRRFRQGRSKNVFRQRFGRGRYDYGISAYLDEKGDKPLTPKLENADVVWGALSSAGLSDYAVAGALGNMRHESGLNPNQLNTTNDGGYGLCQWTASRRDDLVKFCQEKNLDPSSIEGQINFFFHEAAGDYFASLNRMGGTREGWANAKSPEEAAQQFLLWFEGINDGTGPDRQGYAREFYDKYQSGKNSSTIDFNSVSVSVSGAKSNGGKKSKPKGIFAALIDKFTAPYDSMMGDISNTFTNSSMGKSMSALADLFGLSGGEEAASSSGGSTGSGDIKNASKWAQSRVGSQGYGNNGCTAFVNEYLKQAKQPTIPMYVPTAETQGKTQGTPYKFKQPSEGAIEGDVVLLNTLKGDAEADHVVIADGKGNYWGNSSSQNKILFGNIADDFGSQYINGYLSSGNPSGSSSGSDSKGNVPTGDSKRSESEIKGDSTLDAGTGKFFGRAKGVSKDMSDAISDKLKQKNIPTQLHAQTGRSKTGLPKERISNMQSNYSSAISSRSSYDIYSSSNSGTGKYYGAGDISQISTQSASTYQNPYADEVLRVLYSIDAKLSGINNNTAGIGSIQENNAKTNKKIDAVEKNMNNNLSNVSSTIFSQLSGMANGIQSIVDNSTSSLTNKTVSQLQYLAAK